MCVCVCVCVCVGGGAQSDDALHYTPEGGGFES